MSFTYYDGNWYDSSKFPKVSFYDEISGEYYTVEFTRPQYNLHEGYEQLDRVTNKAPSGVQQNWKGETEYHLSFDMMFMSQSDVDAWKYFMKIALGGSSFKYYPDKSENYYIIYTCIATRFEPRRMLPDLWNRFTWSCNWLRRRWLYDGVDGE